ncbi:MAG: hypothetical protein JRF58_12950 [Deltaproteobacteria bacterium]|jgi:glutamate formiminotransferase|nr:hypothetical protein [Deltaproteobacteria bacterium]
MSNLKKIMECVPNFSEGRNLKKIEKIVDAFRGKDGVKLLDYQRDEDHNRLVVTLVGSEIVGLVPMAALLDTAIFYLGIENFSMDQVLETRIMA